MEGRPGQARCGMADEAAVREVHGERQVYIQLVGSSDQRKLWPGPSHLERCATDVPTASEAMKESLQLDTPTAEACGILGSTITAFRRRSDTISPSVQSSEDGSVSVCPTVPIWRVRLSTIPTGRMAPRLVIARASLIVPSWFDPSEVFPEGTRNHEFPKSRPRRDEPILHRAANPRKTKRIGIRRTRVAWYPHP